MAYIEYRNGSYMGFHTIPPKARDALGKARFAQSLQTQDRQEAKRRLIPLETRWRREIAEATSDDADGLAREYGSWYRAIRDAKAPGEREAAVSLLEDEVQDKVMSAARRAGIKGEDDPAIYELPAYQAAVDGFKYATGQKVPLTEHVEKYLSLGGKAEKTVYQIRRQVDRWAERLPYIDDITGQTVQAEIERRIHAGNSPATIRRDLSMMRNYWRYLTRAGHAPADSAPFNDRYIPPVRRKAGDKREPFKTSQAVQLLRGAIAKGDDPVLVDLIRLAMFTGARRRELTSLTVDDVEGGFLFIRESKTDAGRRAVPIHPMLCDAVDRMVRETTDGYLLPGLEETRHGDRGDAVGKRFGNLKRAQNFGKEHVFHSFRHTVVTLMENAGVPENIVADVVGHEKANFTFRQYSGGAGDDPRVDAVGRIEYPELETRSPA